ncbi:hypothetical protein EJB05_15066 [Eragrostis curvula]|uniref:CASP-like protein n=1 Tax=Eragrostis curvula TaxID=38414 RepID=A0A5J9W079_9POAL|nr:hypothetical protein EJB05_15066 [Eragrostis curvula]
MAAAYAFATNSYGVFRFLMCTMFGQFLWSFLLACVDVIAMKKQFNLRVRPILLPLGFIDWAMAVLAFAASSSSAGVAFFFERDTNMCELYAPQLCRQYKTSVVLAFVTWCFSAASAVLVSCIRLMPCASFCCNTRVASLIYISFG